jgi:hypothetical protein
MKKYLIYLIILVSYLASGQEKKVPEDILCSPVLLLTNIGQGSGLFMADSINIYFVTARHNLFTQEIVKRNKKIDTIYNFLPISGKFIFYPHNIVKDDQSIINIDLKGSYKDSLVKFDKKHDIAIISIGNIRKVNDSLSLTYYIKHITKDKSTWIHTTQTKNIRSYSEINIGADIYLFGYPGSIGLQQKPQFDYYRPLLRKGIIASKYEKNKTIIIDSPSYFGNSGGPVFEIMEKNQGVFAGLIGLISEYIPYIEEWENKNNGAINSQTMNSGYSIVTPIDYALSLIKKFK